MRMNADLNAPLEWSIYLKGGGQNCVVKIAERYSPAELGRVIEDLRRFLVPLLALPDATSYWPSGGPWSNRIS